MIKFTTRLLIKPLFFALLICSLNNKAQGEEVNSLLEKFNNNKGERLNCEFLRGNIKGVNVCKIEISQSEINVNLKESETKIPLNQIIARNIDAFFSTNLTSRVMFIETSKEIHDNQTNILFIYSKRTWRNNLGGLEFLYKNLLQNMNLSEKNNFKYFFNSKEFNAVNETLTSNNLRELLKTKTCIRCDLRNVNLESVNLKKSNLEGSNLEGAILTKANLSYSYLVGVNFNRAKMNKVNLEGSFLNYSSMKGANLQDASLSAEMQDVDLSDATLHKSKGSGSSFRGANLTNVDLSMSRLFGVDLSHANLSNANLSNANLSPLIPDYKSNVSQRSNLAKANFSTANMFNANLRESNLFETNLRGANLEKANLRGAVLCSTIMTDGTPESKRCEKKIPLSEF